VIVIQLLLTVLLISMVVVYFAWLRSKLSDRIVVVVLAAGALLLVLHPELTMALARAVGVGRGVDLITYLTLFGFGFVILVLVSRIRNLQDRQIELTRAIALLGARIPPCQPQPAGPEPARPGVSPSENA
jgi:hypothetical protein